jgi:hypothetical protein
MCEMTVASLAVELELGPLEENANARGWKLEVVSPTVFHLGLMAKDNEKYWLKIDCDAYPTMPPSWHWLDPETKELDAGRSVPRGSGYFHGSNVICAPWNRLAYKDQNPNGPHADWTIGDWRSNTKTGECTTLCSMALIVATKLQSVEYQGRGA